MAHTYGFKVDQDTGVYTAVVRDEYERELERKTFATLEEAEAYAHERLKRYSGPMGDVRASVSRARTVIRRLKEAVSRARIKPRYDRDEVV